MTGPVPAVAAVRVAVRDVLRDLAAGDLVLVACSGGADSLALAAATAFEGPRMGLRAGAVVIDHGLQAGSADVASRAAAQCRDLCLDPVETVAVQVARAGEGPEAAARSARYAALEEVRARLGAAAVLLGHTRDDQAEQVLLGLARGSGARSLSGMSRRRGPFVRPLLDVARSVTRLSCEASGLEPWDDPHNQDPAYRRVRARALLARLEADLGPGVSAALARSAALLREDDAVLSAMAVAERAALGRGPWEASRLAAAPLAIRTRVWRVLALEAGVPAGSLFASHLRALDALVSDWHGQGAVALPGRVRGWRAGGQVSIAVAGAVQ